MANAPNTFVTIDGVEHSCEVSQDTYEIFTDGCLLRNKPVGYYLGLVVQLYGSLTEENIKKFMDEKWVM